jgi:hypothetical protein
VDFAGDHIAAGPIHAGDEVSGASFADDGIAFPIAEPRTFVGFLRAFIDGSFAQDLALARGFAVGLATGLAGDPQERRRINTRSATRPFGVIASDPAGQ